MNAYERLKTALIPVLNTGDKKVVLAAASAAISAGDSDDLKRQDLLTAWQRYRGPTRA